MFVKFFSGESDVFVKFFSGESDVFVNGKLPEITACLWKTPYSRHCRFPALFPGRSSCPHGLAPPGTLPTLTDTVVICLYSPSLDRPWACLGRFVSGWLVVFSLRRRNTFARPLRLALRPSVKVLLVPADSFKSVRPTLHSISVPRCPVFPGFGEGKTGHRKRRKLMAQTFTPRTTGLREATLCNAGGQTNDFPQ